jgi:hypothetical protein
MKPNNNLVGAVVTRLIPFPANGVRASSHRLLQPEGSGRERGVTLIDCLVYIALSVILLTAAGIAFSRFQDNTKGLRRNADDITRALHVGEVWRMDIRAATGAIEAELEDQTIHIPTRTAEVSYRFADAQVWRKANRGAEWTAVLAKVKHSQMQADDRARVKAWRWEVELETVKKSARVRPLFTFVAVPGHPSKP